MRRFFRWVLIARLLTVLSFISVSHAQQAKQQEPNGIEVGKQSPLRYLVPEEALEQEAEKQYSAMKAEAQKQHVLVPAGDLQVVRLRAIANRIIPHTARWNERASKWNWEINLFSSKQVNAFCMPGGKIAFFSGILTSLQLTDDEVAIVMGHEIAHALREHSREQAAKDSLLNLGTRLGASIFNLGDIGQALLSGGSQLAMMKFSRADETEADIVGLDIVARAGYDPRAGIALWQKMNMLSKSAPPNGCPPIHPEAVAWSKSGSTCSRSFRFMPKRKIHGSTRCLPITAM